MFSDARTQWKASKDLVISRDDVNLIKGVSVSSMLFDRFLINNNVFVQCFCKVYGNNLFKLKLFHIENISQLTRMVFLLIG